MVVVGTDHTAKQGSHTRSAEGIPVQHQLSKCRIDLQGLRQSDGGAATQAVVGEIERPKVLVGLQASTERLATWNSRITSEWGWKPRVSHYTQRTFVSRVCPRQIELS